MHSGPCARNQLGQRQRILVFWSSWMAELPAMIAFLATTGRRTRRLWSAPLALKSLQACRSKPRDKYTHEHRDFGRCLIDGQPLGLRPRLPDTSSKRHQQGFPFHPIWSFCLNNPQTPRFSTQIFACTPLHVAEHRCGSPYSTGSERGSGDGEVLFALLHLQLSLNHCAA